MILEILGLGTNQNFKKTNFRIIKLKTEITKILSRDFVSKKRKLNISWMKPNLLKLEQGIELLDKKIKASENEKRKEEKSFDKIFRNYSDLLLKRKFSRTILS